MSRRRRLAVGVALLAVASLILGAGGFSSVTADRSVTVAVASDENAFLGIESLGVDRCGEQGLVELHNRFPGDTDLTHVAVTVVDTEGGLQVTLTDAPDELPAGASGTVEGRVRPTDGAAGDESMTLRIVVAGDGASVTATRTYPVACSASKPRTGN